MLCLKPMNFVKRRLLVSNFQPVGNRKTKVFRESLSHSFGTVNLNLLTR